MTIDERTAGNIYLENTLDENIFDINNLYSSFLIWHL